MPLVWFASERQKQQWLVPATSDPRGEYLAGWTVSEAAGTPGGTANFDGPAPYPAGIGLTAIHDKKNGEYILNGRKHWPANAGGWDLQGADANVCIVRTAPQAEGSRGLSAIIIPRGTAGIIYEQPISKLGHRICQNNSVVFSDCRVPEENAFAVGNGDLVVNRALLGPGPSPRSRPSASPGRPTNTHCRGPRNIPPAATSLSSTTRSSPTRWEVAMKVEAGRAFAWKAAHYLDLHNADGHAIGPMAKVFCSEMLFSAVFQAMKVVGVNALDKAHPLERYLRDASVFPLYDAGNVGMHMRKICAVMADPAFDPRAIAASVATPFGKQAPPPETQAAGRNLNRQA